MDGKGSGRFRRAGELQHTASRLTLVALLGTTGLSLVQPAFGQSGPISYDFRGADGGCCHSSNGHDGAAGARDFVVTDGGKTIATHNWTTAIAIDVSGGNGGDSHDLGSGQHWGGNGGIGRIISYTLQNSSISSGGWGVSALSKGGDGGRFGYGKNWGNGADGHDASLAILNTRISAFGLGVSATSWGGTGQASAVGQFGEARDAGVGGSAGAAKVTLNGTSSITVQSASVGAFPNDYAAGIRAQSIGGQGGLGADNGSFGGHSTTGPGGGAGAVTVTTESTTTITTAGDNAFGILARSVGGSAGQGNPGPNVKATNGGGSGPVSVDSAAGITTSGANSPGIFAQSAGGDGGDGGEGTWGGGHDGGAGGTPGGVSVTNGGAIATGGQGSNGITVLVHGGRGGIGGASGVSGRGGSGGAGAGTGATAATIDNHGSIRTSGMNSFGIYGHAVGGSGGASANSSGLLYVGGGNGGNGGNGGAVTASHQGNGSIATSGDHSAGVLLQSIGGGGGAGGDADSTGIIAAIAVGGRGGEAGNGDALTLNMGSATIDTKGASSSGIVLQSTGGGGGHGGSAKALAVGPLFTLTNSIGGSGGQGGSAGTIALTLAKQAVATTGGALSHVIVAQSTGGGGGTGAFAESTQATIAPQLGPDIPTGTLGIQHTVGGSGGSGGDGGAITIGTAGNLSTKGGNALGILAQSIGGGGGNAGFAAAPLRPTSIGPSNFQLSFGLSVGGSGGAGGHGASVTVDNAAGGMIQTGGAQSLGILVQSVGGGGGHGGSVQQETDASFAAIAASPGAFLGALKTATSWLENGFKPKVGTITAGTDIRIAGKGGGGGDGGAVLASNAGGVTTTGTSAAGIIAQSIGGGGGNGGVVQASEASSLLASVDNLIAAAAGAPGQALALSPNIGVNVAIGGGGGAGGNGGTVAVTNSGSIDTSGFSAAGIVAQSIAGGGGTGSSAEQSLADAVKKHGGTSAPEILKDLTTLIELLDSKLLSAGKTIGISLGRGEGANGNAGSVTVDANAASSRIATAGDAAPGVLAQSIGGGGGKGDVQSSFSLSGQFSAPLSIALGTERSFTSSLGTMSSGSVSVGNGGSITTTGNLSPAILAQSISAGGGAAAVAIDADAAAKSHGDQAKQTASIALGGVLGHSGGASASLAVGDVTVTSSGKIATSGVLAHGVMAQSIGGGGGAASLALGANAGGLLNPADIALGVVGKGSSVMTTAGPVSTSLSGGIATTGDLSFGLLAQSVGAGGGYVALLNGGQATAAAQISLNATNNAFGHGGAVTSTLDAGAVIETKGRNSVGLFAQSIGGGGGVAALGVQPNLVTLASPVSHGFGDGGAVNVMVGGKIDTKGAGAIGVLAQSIGGGGGSAGDFSSVSYGTELVKAVGILGGAGQGGVLTVAIGDNASVATSGANAPAILAMSLGSGAIFKDGGIFLKNAWEPAGNMGGPIAITIGRGATVSAGGEGSPAIVTVSTGSANHARSHPITIDVGQGAYVAGAGAGAGTAILVLNDAGTAIRNSGTIAGSVVTGSSANAFFVNLAGGRLYSGSLIDASLQNSGTLNPGGRISEQGAITTTRIGGAFQLAAGGIYEADIDFAAKRADMISVAGPATLAGGFTPLVQNPVANTRVQVAHFDAVPTGSLPVVNASLIFNYALSADNGGRDLYLTADANFQPQGVALNQDQANVAGHLQTLWGMGDARAGAVFGRFAQVSDGTSHAQALNAAASDAALARSNARGHESFAFVNRLMSCPYFLDTGARLAEGECVWGRVAGNRVDRTGTGADVGYNSRQVTYQVGAQKALAPDWFLGGSLSYSRTTTTSTGRAVETESDSIQGGITLKRQFGPWQFAAALFGAYETASQRRDIALPGFLARADSDPAAYILGARARASYELPLGAWYVKPYADLDLTYDHASAYRETGAGPFDLAYRAARHFAMMATPGIEIGGRIDLPDATLRPYLAAGVSFVAHGDAKARLGLAEFPAAPFEITTEMPKVYGNVTAGLELVTSKGWEIKAEYALRGARNYTDQSATLRMAMRF